MANEVKLEEQSSEQLAFMLNQQYTTLMGAQQNISVINKELERRQSLNKEQENG